MQSEQITAHQYRYRVLQWELHILIRNKSNLLLHTSYQIWCICLCITRQIQNTPHIWSLKQNTLRQAVIKKFVIVNFLNIQNIPMCGAIPPVRNFYQCNCISSCLCFFFILIESLLIRMLAVHVRYCHTDQQCTKEHVRTTLQHNGRCPCSKIKYCAILQLPSYLKLKTNIMVRDPYVKLNKFSCDSTP